MFCALSTSIAWSDLSEKQWSKIKHLQKCVLILIETMVKHDTFASGSNRIFNHLIQQNGCEHAVVWVAFALSKQRNNDRVYVIFPEPQL